MPHQYINTPITETTSNHGGSISSYPNIKQNIFEWVEKGVGTDRQKDNYRKRQFMHILLHRIKNYSKDSWVDFDYLNANTITECSTGFPSPIGFPDAVSNTWIAKI